MSTNVSKVICEMVCCEQTILSEIADPKMTRLDVAQTYWFTLRSSEAETFDFAKVNKAIMDRWSFSALNKIKEAAWKNDLPTKL